MRRFLLLLATLLQPGAALAAPDVAVRSSVFVERASIDSKGQKTLVLQAPDKVVPGDNLVFVLNYRNTGKNPAANFTVTNPLPRSVAFQRSQDGRELVSVNGGTDWGRLADLRVPDGSGGWRKASPEDVTHIKWVFSNEISGGSEGSLVFRGIVK